MTAGDSAARLIDEATVSQLVTDLGADAVAEVSAAFLADAPQTLDALRSGFIEGDAVSVARSAHRLKSSSAFLGLARVSSVCAEIETLARNERLEEVASRIEAVSVAVDRASGELAALVERLVARSQPSGPDALP